MYQTTPCTRRHLCVLLLGFYSLLLNAQTYNGLYREKSKVTDTNNHIFTPGKQLTYLASFDNPEQDSIWIRYSVLSLKNNQKTNKRQTEVGITYSNVPNSLEQTGIVENEINLWLHPPRSREFKLLEVFPYPYLQFDETSWKTTLLMSGHWIDTIDNKQKIQLNLSYENRKEVLLTNPLGELQCLLTESSSESALGTFHLSSYYHPEYGFVQLNYSTNGRSFITLTLISVSEGAPIIDPLQLILPTQE